MKQPEIRFNGFSDEWLEKKLGDISNLYQPKTISSKELINKGVPVFGANGYIGYYSESNHATDQVTISARGNVGIPSYVEGPVWITGNSMVVGVDDKPIDKQFLYSSFLEHDFKKYVTGSVQPQLTREALVNVPIQLPTLPEQQKIGALFSKYDAIIASREQKLEELNALKKGLLQQMFDDGHKPQIRFSGFNDDWVEKKLGDVASFSRGNGYTKNDLVESGSPIILYGRLYTKYETIIKNVDTFVKKKANSIISEGFEVIVPASGESSKDISRASAVAMSGLILGGDLNVIKPLNHIDSVFLALTISNGSQQRELSKRAQGKSIVHLHSADLKQVDFSYPSFPEQQKIGQLFEKLDARISNEQTKIEQLKVQKQGLLQRML